MEVARGSERVVDPGTAADTEELEQGAVRLYTKLCRMITHGITTSGWVAPRAALITAIREQYKVRRRWRAILTRQTGESEEGEGAYTFEQITEMAAKCRCPLYVKVGSCRPWVPKDRWDWPDEVDCMDSPEVDFMRFIAGFVDAIELADRW